MIFEAQLRVAVCLRLAILQDTVDGKAQKASAAAQCVLLPFLLQLRMHQLSNFPFEVAYDGMHLLARWQVLCSR